MTDRSKTYISSVMVTKTSGMSLDKRRKYDDAFRAAACVLRLSVAKYNASALKASSYLRRLSSLVLLFFAVMTQENIRITSLRLD